MVQTAATQTPEAIPDGLRPEEFLTDADLVGFYQRQIDLLDEDDLERAELQAKATRAKVAAAMTEQGIAEALFLAARESAL